MSLGGTTKKATRLLIVFMDFSRFKFQMDRVSDMEAADTMDGFYQLATAAIEKAGGRVVKFIGDATLAVFPETKVEEGVRAILELRREADRFMSDRDWECRLSAKAHFGEVIAGDFGPKGDKRFDIIGRAVNETAMMRAADGIALSDDAIAMLSPELRAKLAKEQNARPH